MVMPTDPFLHAKVLIYEDTYLSIQSNNCYIIYSEWKEEQVRK